MPAPSDAGPLRLASPPPIPTANAYPARPWPWSLAFPYWHGHQMPMPTHESLRGMRPYDVLLEKLKHPNAAEVVKRLELFVAQFEGTDIAVSSNAPNEVKLASLAPVPQQSQPISRLTVAAPECQADRPWNVIRSFLGHLYSQMRESPLW
jgi:hypothetical protein